jgi:hypothetical protein
MLIHINPFISIALGIPSDTTNAEFDLIFLQIFYEQRKDLKILKNL